MMRMRSRVAWVAVLTFAILSLTGCKTLLEEMGGMEGVERFNYAFGPSLLANPAVSPFLDVAAVEQVKKGIENEVAKASKVAPPHAGVDLRTVLREKNLDAAARKGFKESARRSAELAQLPGSATSALMKLIDRAL